MNGAALFVKLLEEQGTDIVFGYPGGTVLSIYDALYQERRRIRHVRTAHEQGAAHAADGYARVSGKTGVCIATSGPGATNLVTGIANAYMDSVPIVFVTGNVPLPLIGTDSFQEVDITGITLSVTKHNFMVKTPEELAPCLRAAFRIANTGRKGPVLVDIPRDIMEMEMPDGSGLGHDWSVRSKQAPEIDPARLEEAVSLIDASKRPLILAGGGIRSAGAAGILLELAKKIQAPICCSLMAAGEIPYSEPLYLGNSGVYGTASANDALRSCDLIIAVGTRFSNRLAPETKVDHSRCRMIHIDADRAEIGKVLEPDCYIVGDARAVTERIWEKAAPHAGWYSAAAPEPEDFYLKTLHELFGDEAYIVTDVGLHQMWAARRYPFEKSGHFITSGGLGTMGFGLGAAIGVQTAHPDKPVILITGDGSFQMNCSELATVAREKLPILTIVVNNGCLGMVHELQKKLYRRRYSETVLKRAPNYAALARAFHIKGRHVRTAEEFVKFTAEIKERRIPALLDMDIRRNMDAENDFRFGGQ